MTSDWLPYEGETCNVCDKTATQVVMFEGTGMAVCRTCKPEQVYEREDY